MRKRKRPNRSSTGTHDLSRREFIGLTAAATAAWFIPGSAQGAFDLPPADLEAWQRTLLERGAPRRYLSNIHTDARMHLGGIGTGNFEIGADGQLTSWQLFNNLREGKVPFYFAVKSGATGRLLQTAGGPDWPRIAQIEMTGEYPIATLRFVDETLPVKLELEALTPWKPLDSSASSLPVAMFTFRAHNPTAQAQTISLAMFFANPVGYSGIGDFEPGLPALGANYNESFIDGPAKGVFLRGKVGLDPHLDRPVDIYVLKDWFIEPPDPNEGQTNYAYVAARDVALPPLDRPSNLGIHVIDPYQHAELSHPTQSVIWLHEAPEDIPVDVLQWCRKSVENGAVLVFSGREMPLLAAYAAATGGKPLSVAKRREDIIFEDFENGYGKWTVEGSAFGSEPAHGTFPDQQSVSGFEGKGLVNSYVNGDDALGKMTSQPFTIERHFIRFLVGGGSRQTTQVRLVVAGKVIRATSGKDNERLEQWAWDVRELAGQTAHIEIVDEGKGGWGHINADYFVFSDSMGREDVFAILEELLPLRFSKVAPQTNGAAGASFAGAELCHGCEHNTVEFDRYVRSLGSGRVVLSATEILNPRYTDATSVRQNAFQILCALTGAIYRPTQYQSAKAPGFGALAVATLGKDQPVSGLLEFEDWSAAWKQFTSATGFSPLHAAKATTPTNHGKTAHGALASTLTVAPGETVEVPFLLSWRFPNKYSVDGDWIGCDYAKRWPDIETINRAAISEYDSFRGETKRFQKSFYEGSLPWWLLDCLSANAATIRHAGVLFRLANGDVYAWEGSNGSCQPTCTHVWGYEQSLARLFPDLEREMRRIDFTHQQEPGGGIHNRTDIPSPPHPTGERPFSDGHASCILKAYREALNSSDEAFSQNYWPKVKRAVEYLIDRDAATNNGQPGGVLQDDQWNTYDEALHGVTTFVSGYYLSALRAGEEWARRMSDTATADRYHEIFLRGQKKLVELCWNGEYFQQYLPDYQQRSGEVGPGCMSDQLIGQWWAHQLDLGYILPRETVVSALRSIFKYNFKSDLTGWKHAPRAYAGDKDKGLIVCTWPKGGRPDSVLLYSDEVWTGLEYEVASLLIYEGLIEEGLSVAKAARDRYDGVPRAPITRNPWCEIECGGHYTRAMSSWSMLLALSGFYCDGPRKMIRFAPRLNPGAFKSFFTAPAAWGRYTQDTQSAGIAVASGQLSLSTLQLPFPNATRVTATLGGQDKPVTIRPSEGGIEISFGTTVAVISAGEELKLAIS